MRPASSRAPASALEEPREPDRPQQSKLADIERLNLPLYRASLLGQLRQIYRAAIRHGLSNARVEAINTQIRLIAPRLRVHPPQALISLATLKRDGLCPPLPGRAPFT